MSKYKVKISIIGDDTISLNEFHVTLAGSDIDITDVVMRGEPIDELLNRQELEELQSGKHNPDNLEFSKKDNRGRNGNGRSSRNNNNRSSGRSANSRGRSNERHQNPN